MSLRDRRHPRPDGQRVPHRADDTEIPGSTVLVTGCGPIGIFAVGICRAAGASRIIASDVNPTRLALARTMGAHDAVHPAGGGGSGATPRRAVSAWTSCSRCRACRARSIRRSRSCASAAECRCSASRPSRWSVDFATEIIFKGITIYGVVGRRMYETWIQMTQFLRSGQFDPTPVITHRFPLERFDDAIARDQERRARARSCSRSPDQPLGDTQHPMTLNAAIHRRPRGEAPAARDDRVYKRLNYLDVAAVGARCRWRGAARS